MDELFPLYSDAGPERIGFILRSGEIIEVTNISPTPTEAASIAPEDLIKYEHIAWGTWHSHPGGVKQLSNDDYRAFSGWPSLRHVILGTDGIACYFVLENGAVVRDEAPDYPSRQAQEAVPS